MKLFDKREYKVYRVGRANLNKAFEGHIWRFCEDIDTKFSPQIIYRLSANFPILCYMCQKLRFEVQKQVSKKAVANRNWEKCPIMVWPIAEICLSFANQVSKCDALWIQGHQMIGDELCVEFFLSLDHCKVRYTLPNKNRMCVANIFEEISHFTLL